MSCPDRQPRTSAPVAPGMQRSTPLQYVASSQSESALHAVDVSVDVSRGVVASEGPSSSPHARIEESTQTTQSFERIAVEGTR